MTASPMDLRRRPRALLALALALLLVTTSAAAAAPPKHANNDREFTVMTRNLYLGASLAPLFPEGGLEDEFAFFLAASAVWAEVQFTDFPTRAGELAAEIVEAQPHLVGLQEVTLYRTGPPDGPGGQPATDVHLDFLDVLMAELDALGARYRAVVVGEAFDGELTAFTGMGDFDGVQDIRLTDRDVILVRRDAPVQVSNPQAGLFDFALELPVLEDELRIDRGWTSVDVRFRGQQFRFINTHFEAFHPGVAMVQAIELIDPDGGADTDLPVVLVGDINAEQGDPAYNVLMGPGGFTDVAVDGADTCCFDSSLADPDAVLDERIDVILYRGPFTSGEVTVTGTEPFRVTAPLWASDHAGVVARLVINETRPAQE
jgi:hypothetical protein